MYVRGLAWIVVDRIESDREREIEALWHFHPNVDVRLEDMSSIASHESGSMIVQPVGKWVGFVQTVTGQEPPDIQGWYSREYNKKTPATCTVYQTKTNGKAMVWVIVPSKEGTANVDVTTTDDGNVVRVSGSISGKQIDAVIPTGDGKPSLSVE